MKEEDRLLLTFVWATLLIGIISLICKVTYRMDQIDKKLDSISASITASLTDATITDAHTVTDALPEEPGDDEIVMSIRPELLDTSESVQEASETILEELNEEIVTEEFKAVPEASEEVTESTESSYGTYLGSYELTAYAWTGNPCANGNYPTVGYTVASNSIPMGSRIYIEGYGEYVVEDCGGMASNVIDVYMGDYDTCIQFGRRSADVYLIE